MVYDVNFNILLVVLSFLARVKIGYLVGCPLLVEGTSLLYRGNMQRMLNKELIRFMQSLSRERQNRASK